MFRAKTVLIVGAGASAEFGFPLGGALLEDIAERVNIGYNFGRLERGDYVVAEALRCALNAREDLTSYNEHLHSAWQLVASSKQGRSIDNVLDALEDEKASRVGKFGIVRSILAAEEASPLSKWADHFPEAMDIGAFSKTWLDHLAKVLIEDRRKSDIENVFENLSIINFNYDRVIEHYLPFVLANYYGLKPAAVREVMPTLPILRPYGKAGSLPWEDGGEPVRFGKCEAADVELAARQILTFTEQISDKQLMANMRQVIAEADRIIFLGFGFHRQNLALFNCKAQPHLQVLATSFRLSNPDCEVISEEVERCLKLSDISVYRDHKFVRLFPLECASFMSEVWRTLTAGPGDDPTLAIPHMR